MTNEEFYNKKIDEEYQKYLKSLKVPSKEEWLKMNHEGEIHHKFNVGDIIRDNGNNNNYLITHISLNDGMYGMYQLKSSETGIITHRAIVYVDSCYSFVI